MSQDAVGVLAGSLATAGLSDAVALPQSLRNLLPINMTKGVGYEDKGNNWAGQRETCGR